MDDISERNQGKYIPKLGMNDCFFEERIQFDEMRKEMLLAMTSVVPSEKQTFLDEFMECPVIKGFFIDEHFIKNNEAEKQNANEVLE